MRQMAVAAGNKALDVAQDLVSERRRSRRHSLQPREEVAQAIRHGVRRRAHQRKIIDDVQHGFLRIRAEEHLGGHLAISKKLLEGRQISRASGWESISSL